MDISSEISTFFQSTELIIVFVIFLFTLFYQDIQDNAKIGLKDGYKENKRNKDNVRSIFWSKAFILLISMILVVSLLTPVLCGILNSLSNLTLDYGIYSFLVVYLFLFAFFIWSIILSYNILKNIRRLGKYGKSETLKYVFTGK